MKDVYQVKDDVFGVVLFSHFQNSRQKMEDRITPRKCLEKVDYVVKDFDLDPNGKLDYTVADLVITRNGVKKLIECETKGTKGWNYIHKGVDVCLRKKKYNETDLELWLFMVNQNKTESVLIHKRFLIAALDTGEEYEGDCGVESSSNFKMPVHGCRRIRKKVRQESGELVEEDFIRIPFKYVDHYKIKSDFSMEKIKTGQKELDK